MAGIWTLRTCFETDYEKAYGRFWEGCFDRNGDGKALGRDGVDYLAKIRELADNGVPPEDAVGEFLTYFYRHGY